MFNNKTRESLEILRAVVKNREVKEIELHSRDIKNLDEEESDILIDGIVSGEALGYIAKSVKGCVTITLRKNGLDIHQAREKPEFVRRVTTDTILTAVRNNTVPLGLNNRQTEMFISKIQSIMSFEDKEAQKLQRNRVLEIFDRLSVEYITRKASIEVINNQIGSNSVRRVQNYLNIRNIKTKARLSDLQVKHIEYIATFYSNLNIEERLVGVNYPGLSLNREDMRRVNKDLLTETSIMVVLSKGLTDVTKNNYMLDDRGELVCIGNNVSQEEIRHRAYSSMYNMLSNLDKLDRDKKKSLTEFVNLIIAGKCNEHRYSKEEYQRLVYYYIRPNISDSAWRKVKGNTEIGKLYAWLLSWNTRVGYISI